MMNTSKNPIAPLSAMAQAGTSSKTLASLLLAAGVAALVVMADQWLDAWAERHVIAAWLALWAVAVLAMAVLRGLTRHLAQRMMRSMDAWSADVAQQRSDRRLWAMAQTDPRMMTDLQAAFDRSGSEEVAEHSALTQRHAARILHSRLHYI